MSNRISNFDTGYRYFFTLRARENQPLLLRPEARNALREALDLARLNLPFHVEGWVLLPDHLHCIWTLPEDDPRYSSRWSIIRRHVDRALRSHGGIQAKPGHASPLEGWDNRVWAQPISNEREFDRCLDYLHWNPVKHQHVRAAGDWPYSTFERYVAIGHYPRTWNEPQDKVRMGCGEKSLPGSSSPNKP